MKLSAALYTLAFAASCVQASPVNAAAKPKPTKYKTNYDGLTGGTPGLLSGRGQPVTGVYRGLLYGGPLSRTFSAINLNGELLPALQPASPPNVVAIKPAATGKKAGTIGKAESSDTLDFKSLYLACAIDALGESLPVACTVYITGGDNTGLGTPKQRFIEYDGGAAMTFADLGLKSIRDLGFTVTKAADADVPVAILIDNLVYTLTPEA